MKNSTRKKTAPGYVSLLSVFTISLFMLTLMLFAYRRAMDAQIVQSDTQVQTDYKAKEDTILRSIVAITPNRAIRAMQDGSDTTDKRGFLSWESIFSEALDQSNARQSVSPELLERLDIPTTYAGNVGDSELATVSRIFKPVVDGAGYVSGALNRDLGPGFPVPLNSNDAIPNDDIYPIIADQKEYGDLAFNKVGLSTTTYKKFNLLTYPQINFGYATPGSPFVAKRNSWAFTLDLAEHDSSVTKLGRFQREFVLSIYEIPSQLPISASAFMTLGTYADGSEWQNPNITGNIFTGRAVVEGSASLDGLATRRGSEMSAASTVGGKNFTGNPFEPGIRENYRLTEGDFFPISLASESGKAAFIPISRGADYFDRFAHTNESQTLSPTTWNNYSVGALQCAMTLDITECVSASDRTPTELTFTYLRNGNRQELVVPLNEGVSENLPEGYILSVAEGNTVNFPTPVDVAYGADGKYYYKDNVSGDVRFDDETFGDPISGTPKYGYYRPQYPFEIKNLPDGRICVAVYPERFNNFLALLGADNQSINNSIAVNVDYVNSTNLTKPLIPCTVNDYGVILQECADFTAFTKGFSLVTNLRLHIGGHFNNVQATPPAGFTPPSGKFYPPCSLFAPERRFGVKFDPSRVTHMGQVGSLASDDAVNPVRPLDTTGVSGNSMSGSDIDINLSAITHPAELPPITMMNWLIIVEEKRKEFY